jgi:hypothetical protein
VRYKVYADGNHLPSAKKHHFRTIPPKFVLDDQKLENSLLPTVRLAEERDRPLLEDFFCMVNNETKEAGKAYASLVLSCGRTYISDIGDSFPFIISSLSVLPNIRGEKYIAFASTLPSLRGRGLMRNLLSIVIEREKTLYGDTGFIFPLGINTNSSVLNFLYDMGAIFHSCGVLCSLKGKDKKRNSLKTMYGYSNFMEETKEKFFGQLEFSSEVNLLIYNYFRAKGGNMCAYNDGFISFLPNHKEKGCYIVTECAISTETLNQLPSAFGKCILPLSIANNIQSPDNEKPDLDYITLAVATFDMGERFINPMFRY